MPALICAHMASTGDLSSGEIGVERNSSDSDSLSDVDLESGGLPAAKLHSVDEKKKKKDKGGRDCRICHLGLESSNGVSEGDCDSEDEEDEEEEEEYYGLPIQLGCSCKGDLGVAHRKCAETWFKIKGNMTCEICGATALNVAGEQANPGNAASATAQAAAAPLPMQVDSRGSWHGRRVMNFLLAGMVFAFIISWLFHFKVLK